METQTTGPGQRLAYRRPQLVVYGSVTELTQAVAFFKGNYDGGCFPRNICIFLLKSG